MKNYSKETLKIFLKEAGNHKLTGFLVMLGATSAYIVATIIPLYFKKFFDFLVSGSYQDLLKILIMILILEIIRWAIWCIAMLALNYFQAGTYKDLQYRCFAYLHKHSFVFFSNNFSGAITKKALNFPKAFIRIFDAFLFNIWSALVSIIIILVVLGLKNIYLGLGIFIWLIIYLAINFKFSKYKFKYDRAHNEIESKVSGDLADTVVNYANVKLFNGFKKENFIYNKLTKQSRQAYLKTLNIEIIFNTVQGLFAVILEIGILYFALHLWRIGQFGIGDFVLLQSYVWIILRQIWSLATTLRNVYRGLSDADEMTEILITPHEIIDVHNAKKLKVSHGLIQFKEVDFSYKQTRRILKKFNLTIKPRQKVALIGPSGAGKTTVIKLLLRNYDLEKGKIMIDGQRIDRVTQTSLWQNISLVPQDPILFHRTIKENIAYGVAQVNETAIIKAAKLANCHQFITALPEGYQTYVGERGIKLSGGERQRIAIARAILRQAPILILDEATSSLDSESERLIQQALDNLMKDKTVIVIAHRLSTIKKMDRIVVVDKGLVVEDGKHEELVKLKQGLYRKLWDLQVKGFES